MTIDPRLNRIVADQPYPLLFATISGAHLYGFPSPDSDFDLRGAHVLPLEIIAGLEIKDETLEQSMIVPAEGDGAEGRALLDMDIVSHDVRKFFKLLLKNNGYVLEQLFSPLIVHTTAEHAELKEICRARPDPRSSRGDEAPTSSSENNQSLLTSAATGVITRNHYHHYRGFMHNQWKLALNEGIDSGDGCPRVKPVLYMLRVALTGIHLLRTRELNANLLELNEIYILDYLPELIEQKQTGEQARIDGGKLALLTEEFQRLDEQLTEAYENSTLPESPSAETRAAINDLLVRIRLNGLTDG